MARAHFTKSVIRRVSGVPADGTYDVQAAGGTALGQSVFAADTGGTALVSPIAFSNGVIDFFLDNPARVRLAITPSGSVAQTFDNVDVGAPAGLKTLRIPHTFAVPGELLAVSGQENVIPGFYVVLPAGQSAKLTLARHKLGAGSATITLSRNGVTVPGAAPAVGTTAVTTDFADLALADGDLISVTQSVLSAASNLSFSVFIDYSVV